MNYKQYFLLIIAGINYNCASSHEFGYEGPMGPAHWGEHYSQCTGKHQSPININDLNVKYHQFDNIVYERFTETPIEAKVTNNGHTVMVHLTYESKAPVIWNGPLAEKGAFEFEQFHFHWGADNAVGSEDRINNATFAGELHIVFRNEQYATLEEAALHSDGITVLAFFYELKNTKNQFYEELINSLENIIEVGAETHLPTPTFSLMDVIDTDLLNYYTYIGSLTTPPCSEDVVWIDYINPTSIPIELLEHFRKLKTFNNSYLTHNFRPIQPLNNRTIYKITTDTKTGVIKSTSIRFYPMGLSTYMFVFCFLCMILKKYK